MIECITCVGQIWTPLGLWVAKKHDPRQTTTLLVNVLPTYKIHLWNDTDKGCEVILNNELLQPHRTV